jgi:tyrosinase
LYKHVRYWAVQTYGKNLERYALAADSFRMPYWDWAQANGSVPEFFTTEMIDVTHPDGSEMTIWNPLYAFYFHPIPPKGFDKKVSLVNKNPQMTLTISIVPISQPHTALAYI